MSELRIYYGLITVLIVVFIVPFLYVSGFTNFAMDDLCRAFLNHNDYIVNLQEWYLHHNGRFVNAVFALLPVYQIHVYRLVIAFQFLILGFLLFHYLSSVLNNFQVDVKKVNILFLSVAMYIILLSGLPSVFEFLYWYAAVTVYLFSFYLILLLFKYALQFYIYGKSPFYIWGIVILLLVGNNELFIGPTILLLLLLLFQNYFRSGKWNFPMIVMNLVAWIAAFVVILSPGTSSRKEQFEYSGNFMGGIKISTIRTAEYLLEHLLQFPYAFFYIILLLFVLIHRSSGNKVKPVNPLQCFGFTLVTFFLMFFTLFYATGTLDIYTGRIGSFINAIMVLILSFNCINLAVFLKHKHKMVFTPVWPGYLVVSILILITITGFYTDNYNALRRDIISGDLNRFENNYKTRQHRFETLEKNQDTLILNVIEGTRLMQAGDIDIKNRQWVKDCYIQYLNESYDLNVSNLELK